MNYKLKPIFFCATSNRTWGKGRTIKEAKKNAKLIGAGKGCEYYIQAALFNSDGLTDAELDNLYKCITVDDVNGSPRFYDFERTQEDTDMITKYHVGWCVVETNMKNI